MNPDVQQALAKENTLMLILAAVAAVYAEEMSTTPEDHAILDTWAPHFRSYRDVNEQIIADGGVESGGPNNEVVIPDILRQCLATNGKAGVIAKAYEQLFDADEPILQLLAK